MGVFPVSRVVVSDDIAVRADMEHHRVAQGRKYVVFDQTTGGVISRLDSVAMATAAVVVGMVKIGVANLAAIDCIRLT